MIFQKKILIKWLIGTGICLAIGFAIPTYAYAVGFSNQDDSSSQETNADNYGSRQTLGEPSKNFILGSTDEYVNLKLKVQVGGTGSFNPQIYIWKDDTFKFFAVDCGTIAKPFDDVFQFSDTCKTDSEEYLKDYEFQTGHSYKFNPYISNGSGKFYGSTNADSYLNGECVGNNCSPLADLYFNWGEIPNSISIDFPANGTSTQDFAAWYISGYQIPTASTTWYQTAYDTTSTDLWTNSTHFNDIELRKFDGSFSNYPFLKFNLLEFNKTYYAQARFYTVTGINLFTGSSTLIVFATSSLISFNTLTGYQDNLIHSYYTMPTSTASSTDWVLSCDPNAGLVANSICKVLLYLFSPKQADLNRFNDLKVAVQNKAPMGYLTQTINLLGNFSVSSTPAFALSNASAGLDTYVYNPLKTGLTWLLWIGWGVWLFQRIRNLYFTI